MIRKLVRVALILFLVYLPISLVINQITMREKLSSVAAKFDAVVDDHEARSAKFNGELDSILVERNIILKQERNLIFGNWNTSIFRTNPILYLNNTWWMPDDIYNMMTKIQFDGTANFLELIFGMIFFFLPIILYIFGWLSVKYFLVKPTH